MAKVVFSYSHVDEELRNQLEKHLATLKRTGAIETWHDRKIIAGQDFSNVIDSNFSSADIILLLISPDFINSDFCYDVEMAQALQRHHAGESIVIPVILRPCDWHPLPFGKILAATKDGTPIVKYAYQDDGFLEVAQSVRSAISSLKKAAQGKTATSNSFHVKEDLGARLSKRNFASIRKEFTEHERDMALTQCFERMKRFFSSSMEDLESSHSRIQTNIRLISENSFEATVYFDGKRRCHCAVWAKSPGGGIFFSHTGITDNSYNDSLNVADDGFSLGFRALGFAFHGIAFPRNKRNDLLTEDDAVQYFWEIFSQPLR